MGILRGLLASSLALFLCLGVMAQGQKFDESFPRLSGNQVSDLEPWTSHFYTVPAGDKSEIKIDGKKGQTIFVVASSFNVTPTISIGGVKNHGQPTTRDHKSFLAFAFPEDREYRIVIENSESKSIEGLLSTRVISPIDLKMGTTKTTFFPVTTMAQTQEIFLHVKAEKGKTYFVDAPTYLLGNVKRQIPFNRIIGPTGSPEVDTKRIRFWDYRQAFEAKSTGDYYLGYMNTTSVNEPDLPYFTTRLGIATVMNVPKIGSTKIHVEPHGFAVVRFPVQRGDFIRTITTANYDIADRIEAPLPTVPIGNGTDVDAFRSEGFIFMVPNLARGGDFIRLFGGTGEVALAISGATDNPTDVTLTNRNDFEELKPTTTLQTVKKSVSLGENHFFLIRGEVGEHILLNAKGEGIEPFEELFTATGQRLRIVDRTTHLLTTRMSAGLSNQYLFCLGAEGGGGTGKIVFEYQRIAAKPYKFDTMVQGDPTESLNNTFSVKLEAGKTYRLELFNCNQVPRLYGMDNSILDPAAPATKTDASTMVQYVCKKSGEYRLNLVGASSESKFRFGVAP